MLTSDNWVESQKVVEEMNNVEDQLKEYYRMKQLNEVSKAINHIVEDPANFFKYTRKFKYNDYGIGTLKEYGKLFDENIDKVEIL